MFYNVFVKFLGVSVLVSDEKKRIGINEVRVMVICFEIGVVRVYEVFVEFIENEEMKKFFFILVREEWGYKEVVERLINEKIFSFVVELLEEIVMEFVVFYENVERLFFFEIIVKDVVDVVFWVELVSEKFYVYLIDYVKDEKVRSVF